MAELEPATERALRARILELETLVEARTQAIVGLGTEVAELRGTSAPAVADRRSFTRRLYAKLRGRHG